MWHLGRKCYFLFSLLEKKKKKSRQTTEKKKYSMIHYVTLSWLILVGLGHFESITNPLSSGFFCFYIKVKKGMLFMHTSETRKDSSPVQEGDVVQWPHDLCISSSSPSYLPLVHTSFTVSAPSHVSCCFLLFSLIFWLCFLPALFFARPQHFLSPFPSTKCCSYLGLFQEVQPLQIQNVQDIKEIFLWKDVAMSIAAACVGNAMAADK